MNHQVEQTTLDKIIYNVSQQLGAEYMIESVDVDRYSEMITGNIVIHVRGFIYGQEREQIVEYPLDWWQAFKQAWFPRWLLVRYPVVNKKVVIGFKALFPDFRPSECLGQVCINSFRRD